MPRSLPLLLLGPIVVTGIAAGQGPVRHGDNGIDEVTVIALAPIGSVQEDFFFGLYWSSRLHAKGASIEPGFPAGWATTLSLRLLSGKDGVPELRDPTGRIHHFIARDSGDLWSAGARLVLTDAPDGECGARLTDPEGYRWLFDEAGYLRGLTLPDGTRVTIARDADTNRMMRIDIAPVAPWEPARRAGDIRYHFWKWPVFCRWPRSGKERLYLAAGRSLPGAVPIGDVPPASFLCFQWADSGDWTLGDGEGRCWFMLAESPGTARLWGTTVYPDREQTATVTVGPSRQRARHLPAWLLVSPAARFESARPRPDTFPPEYRTQSPITGRRFHPLARCPQAWEQCGSTLDLPDGGLELVSWTVPGLLWDDCYRGMLFWNKRYHSSFAMSCTPGSRRTRTVEWTKSVEVELAAELGLDGIGSVRSGITETRTLQVTDTFELSCGRFQDEEGIQRQSCRQRWFQPVYDHVLHYWKRDRSTGLPEGPICNAKAVWLGDVLDSLRCCDECGDAGGPR